MMDTINTEGADLFATRQIHTKIVLGETKALMERAGLQPGEETINMMNRAIEGWSPGKIMMAYSVVYMDVCMRKASQLGEEKNFVEAQKWALEGMRMGQDAENGRLKMVAHTCNAYVDFFTGEAGGHQMDEYEAIAFMTNTMRPKPPENWPNVSAEDKIKVSEADKNTAQKGSDGAIIWSDVNLCRHARSLSYDICEMRGLNPYAVSMRMENAAGEQTGHAIVVVMEKDDEGNETPVFIDGHNNIVDRGIDALNERWSKVGWKLTKCKAERMVSTTEERLPDGRTRNVNTVWDVKNFV